MEIIADGLRTNNTILGIHLMGNEGEIDPWGFIKKEPEDPHNKDKPKMRKNLMAQNQFMNRIKPVFGGSTGIINN